MRDAAGEFHHLEAALDVALGVGEGLAVLGRQQLGEVVVFLLDQLEELEHHAGAPLRIGRRPGRLRRFGIGDGVLDLGMLGERDLGLHLAGIGIEDVAEPPGGALDRLAADEMADLAHESLSSGFLRGPGRGLGASAAHLQRFSQLFGGRSPGSPGPGRPFFFHDRLAFTAP